MLIELFFAFLKIGVFTFGGGYGMIPLIEREVVTNRQWLSHQELLEIIAIAESTPGPVAINCATFIGFRRGSFLGALFATLGVVLPAFIIMLLIATFLYQYRNIPNIAALLNGIRPAALGLIAYALYRLSSQGGIVSIKDCIVTVGVFATLIIFGIHPIWMIILAGLLGYLMA